MAAARMAARSPARTALKASAVPARERKFVIFQTLRGAPAKQIHGGVVRDGEQPGIEAARGIVAMELADHVQPGLLKQIVGRGGIADQPQEIAIQPVLILADGLCQGGGVAAAQACDLGGGFRHGETLVDSRLVNHNRIGCTGEHAKKTQVNWINALPEAHV